MANENITQPLTLPKNVTAPFYWSESVFRQALGRDMSKIILGGGTVLAMDGKDLIEPYYQAIADNLWSHAETAIRTRTLPEHLFVTEIQTPGLVR